MMTSSTTSPKPWTLEDFEARTKEFYEERKTLVSSRMAKSSIKTSDEKAFEQKIVKAVFGIENTGQVKLRHVEGINPEYHSFFCNELPGFYAGGPKRDEILFSLSQIVSDWVLILYGYKCRAVQIRPAEAIDSKEELQGELIFELQAVNES